MASDPLRALTERVEMLEAALEQVRQECAQLRARLESPARAPFRVVDDDGHPLMEVALRGHGPHLRLLDSHGHFLVTLAGVASGGTIAVHDPAGVEAVGIASSQRGGSVAISDRTGHIVGWMNCTEGGGHIVTRDQRGAITSLHPGTKEALSAEPELETAPPERYGSRAE